MEQINGALAQAQARVNVSQICNLFMCVNLFFYRCINHTTRHPAAMTEGNAKATNLWQFVQQFWPLLLGNVLAAWPKHTKLKWVCLRLASPTPRSKLYNYDLPPADAKGHASGVVRLRDLQLLDIIVRHTNVVVVHQCVVLKPAFDFVFGNWFGGVTLWIEALCCECEHIQHAARCSAGLAEPRFPRARDEDHLLSFISNFHLGWIHRDFFVETTWRFSQWQLGEGPHTKTEMNEWPVVADMWPFCNDLLPRPEVGWLTNMAGWKNSGITILTNHHLFLSATQLLQGMFMLTHAHIPFGKGRLKIQHEWLMPRDKMFVSLRKASGRNGLNYWNARGHARTRDVPRLSWNLSLHSLIMLDRTICISYHIGMKTTVWFRSCSKPMILRLPTYLCCGATYASYCFRWTILCSI